MKEIVFVTGNEGKFKSAWRHLHGCGVVLRQERIEMIEPQAKEVREVARQKIMQVIGKFDAPVMVEDSGLYVYALNGFPGASSKEILETIGVEGVLKLLEGKDRKCEFRECIAYWEPGFEEPKYFEDTIKGCLAEEPRGEFRPYHWSPFSLIFIPEGLNKTLGEMNEEEYAAWTGSLNCHFKELHEWLKGEK